MFLNYQACLAKHNYKKIQDKIFTFLVRLVSFLEKVPYLYYTNIIKLLFSLCVCLNTLILGTAESILKILYVVDSPFTDESYRLSILVLYLFKLTWVKIRGLASIP